MLKLREKLISYLEENQIATARNLANFFNVTIANIRYHLKILLREGIVEIIDDVNLGQRGRPTQIYSLSKKEKSTGIDILLRSTLEEIDSIRSDRTRKNRLKKLAKIITASSITPSKTLTAQLGSTIAHLNDLDYKAHWEAHSKSPNILLHNCPYSSLIDSFPFLCQLDHLILNELLGFPVTQIEKLVSLQGRHPYCRFTVE